MRGQRPLLLLSPSSEAAAASLNPMRFLLYENQLTEGSQAVMSSGPLPSSSGKPPLLSDRIFSLVIRPNRPLTRSNAVVNCRSPDQLLDMHLSLQKQSSAVPNPPPPPPTPSSLSRTPTPSLKALTSVSLSSTSTSNDYFLLGVQPSRRRHSDSYFPQKRHNRRHKLRGILHPKFSYSPNPRLLWLFLKACEALCSVGSTYIITSGILSIMCARVRG